MVNIKRMGKGTLIEQDLDMIKERIKLYVYILLIPVLNGTGLDTLPSICRKNVLWRDSIASINDTDLTNKGSVIARRSARPMVAPMSTEVMISASSKNCSIELTGKE